MKKITVYIEGGETTVKLLNPLVLTHASKLYVKTAAVFWNYQNIRKGYNDYFSIDKKKVSLDEGYWTFKNLRKKFESHGLSVEEFPDGRIKIGFTKGIKSLNLWRLGDLSGYTSTFSTTHPGDRPVDIHEGLRYVTVGCNLANRSRNIDPMGFPSNNITSLPIDGTKPLFGTTTKYNDIESEVGVDAGIYNELHFVVKSNIHDIVPGNILLELCVI
ncbi:Hypothetical predicted protein [Paramuricea clavata]|uniref:Uncharacterized protein n=1 Tax=Paramuricea clavata TaxID=317549 RepID=A0A7D9DX41_PARCT|nr:Hypothetical predicted protein [Paramuricea clavata]